MATAGNCLNDFALSLDTEGLSSILGPVLWLGLVPVHEMDRVFFLWNPKWLKFCAMLGRLNGICASQAWVHHSCVSPALMVH